MTYSWALSIEQHENLLGSQENLLVQGELSSVSDFLLVTKKIEIIGMS